MPIPSDAGASQGYFARLSIVARMAVTELVRRPSQEQRAEAARRLLRHGILTVVLSGLLIASLMVWFDAWEIALMPARGTAGLRPFRVLTDFGKDTYVLSLTAVLLLGVMLAAPAMRDPARRRLLGIGLRLQFVLLAVSVPIAVGELLKWIIGRGRPFVGGGANAFNFAHFAGTEAYASLPSGHAITAFALAFAVAAVWPRMRGAMIAYALAIALTRLVLLAHHPSDVVAGAAIGIVGAMCVRYWFAVRGLGFAVAPNGVISPLAPGRLKGVAEEAPAP
jgi:membrane-associated phospholipid phosphatase